MLLYEQECLIKSHKFPADDKVPIAFSARWLMICYFPEFGKIKINSTKQHVTPGLKEALDKEPSSIPLPHHIPQAADPVPASAPHLSGPPPSLHTHHLNPSPG